MIRETPFIPPRTRAELAFPASIGQRHEQIKRVVLPLLGAILTPDAVFVQLRSMYEPDVSDREIRNLIEWAIANNPQPCGNGSSRNDNVRTLQVPEKPERVTAEQARANVEKWLGDFRADECDLWHVSPSQPLEDWKLDSMMLLAALYDKTERVNIVTEFTIEEKKDGQKANPKGAGKILLRDQWMRWIRDHGTPQSKAGAWIRPNPVKKIGSSKAGAVTDNDVTSYRFTILESDLLPSELALSFWARLPLPVAAIISSGGKSPHAWIKLDSADAADYHSKVDRIYTLLSRFGLVKATRTNPAFHACQARSVRSESRETVRNGFTISTRTQSKPPFLRGANNMTPTILGRFENELAPPKKTDENVEGAGELQQNKLPSGSAFFDTGRNLYWILNQRGGWIALNETQFKRILRQRNISPKVRPGSYVSPLDERLIEIQQNCDVHYAGALAGNAAGVYDMGERRILITESPLIIEPLPGEWPILKTLIDGLLRDPEFDQKAYLYGWIKVAYEALRAGGLRPGKLLVLAGIHDCGKSLLQNLITKIFGGRAARPYQFMCGLTPFNSDLFEAEHLMIEDEQASYDIRSRRNFGAQLKNITATEWQRCHAKNRVAISLAPFWRLSMSVNDEPENLMVLPPIDDSIEDKIIILRAAKTSMSMPTATLEQRTEFWQRLEGELPAFLDYLTRWEIPSELRSERFGITHFHHPEILQAIDNLAPEFRLLRLIDDELFDDVYEAGPRWEGSAEQLERRLCGDDSKCRHEARKLFTFNTACGVYLSRLAKKHPERFEGIRSSKARTWRIER